MAADHYFRYYVLPADPAGRGRPAQNWGEWIVTGVAVMTAVLIVVLFALLMA
jgi:hypothetical protein